MAKYTCGATAKIISAANEEAQPRVSNTRSIGDERGKQYFCENQFKEDQAKKEETSLKNTLRWQTKIASLEKQ